MTLMSSQSRTLTEDLRQHCRCHHDKPRSQSLDVESVRAQLATSLLKRSVFLGEQPFQCLDILGKLDACMA